MGHVENQHKCRYMLTVNRYTQASNVRSRKIPSESGQPVRSPGEQEHSI
jgi:hypothetical protein